MEALFARLGVAIHKLLNAASIGDEDRAEIHALAIELQQFEGDAGQMVADAVAAKLDAAIAKALAERDATVAALTDRVVTIENGLKGLDAALGGGTDSITGGDQQNGGSSTDTLSGGDSGNGTVTGGAGDDTIDAGAGAGADTITGGGPQDGGGAGSQGGDAVDTVSGAASAGNDTVTGGAGDDSVTSGDASAGAGTEGGGAGTDSVDAGAGDDQAPAAQPGGDTVI